MNGEVVDKIASLVKQPEVIEVGDRQWMTLPEGWRLEDPYKAEQAPEPLAIHTLSGLVDYLSANRDGLVSDEVMVHVVDYNHVQVRSRLLELNKRHSYVAVIVGHPGYVFDRFFDCESFVVALQALFEPTDDRTAILALAGNIRDEKVSTHDDDGVTQTVTARQGVALSVNVKAPNPVTLRPYRTFREIEQPESRFVFRLQAGKDGSKPTCALFEADGGRWKLEAIQRTAAYLREKLPDLTVIA